MSTGTAAVDWERISQLAPRLGASTRIARHSYRGVPWSVIYDTASTQHIRLAAGTWQIVGLMDGERTLEQIFDALATKLGEEAPDQQTLSRVLSELHAAELLDCPELTSVEQFSRRQQQHQSLRWKRWLASPVSQRIPLVDPQSWLDRTLKYVSPVFTRTGFAVWAGIVLLGLWLLVSHWSELAAGLTMNVFSGHNLTLMVLAYVSVKTLHELGHAYALRTFGAEVHEMGVMFLVFLPVPYVDASASLAFEKKSHRIVVRAAGILVELFLSVLALIVWLAVEPGLVREFSFNVLLVAGVSTLLFNGNPLLRFDGYYVLSDALEMPNLGARATRYLGYLAQRYLFGASQALSPVSAEGERRWLFTYGIASFIYRVGILFSIGLFVAQRFPVFGTFLCIWLAATQILQPIIRTVRGLFTAPVLEGHRGRAALWIGIPTALVAVVMVFVPVPAWTYAEGIVWLPEHSQIRAGADGFVREQLAQPATKVTQGDALFRLDAQILKAEAVALERRVEEHQARYDSALFHDREQLEVLHQQLLAGQTALADARSRTAGLLVSSPLSGTLVIPGARHLQDRYVRKGEILGYVEDDRQQIARVVIRQDEIDRVRDGTLTVHAKIAGFPGQSEIAKITTINPSAVGRLPGPALGASGGGRIAIDASDASGRTPAESIFVLDIILPSDAPRVATGTRVFLRFEHQSSSLGAQLTRAIRQLMLAEFGL